MSVVAKTLSIPVPIMAIFFSVLCASVRVQPAAAQGPHDPLVVDSDEDGQDVIPGDGVCATAGGKCTLRAAIMEANEWTNVNAGTPDEIPDRIHFNIPGTGLHTIRPGSALPFVQESAIIDGYTQGNATPNTLEVGNDAVLLIELDGSNAGINADGLLLNAAGSTVRGLVINRFAQDGILVFGFNTNTIEGNFIGTDSSGSQDLGNGNNGVGILDSASNLVGGPVPEACNIISGNGAAGVFIGNGPSQGNEVEGNYIGTDSTGMFDIGNDLDGILISAVVGVNTYASLNRVGGVDPSQGNLISGNGLSGVTVFRGTNNQILGNLIGTSAEGAVALPNVNDGVLLDEASNNVVGGMFDGNGDLTIFNPNVISGNGFKGVEILTKDQPASGNRIVGNFIGTDKDGLQPVPNTSGGVTLSSRAGATAGVVANFVGGTDGDDGTEDGQQASRNIISGNGGNGIDLLGAMVSNNTILGNFIGLDSTGLAKLGNEFNGVLISEVIDQDGAPTGNLIGTDVPTGGNVISGNGRDGVQISFGASGNFVLNNFIGLDVTGTTTDPDEMAGTGDELGNVRHGVSIFDSPDNFVGNGTTAARNIISGNGTHGVFIGVGGDGGGATRNLISGNYIGVTVGGTCAGVGCLAGNGADGIRIESVGNNVIGGQFPREGNLISGNVGSGIHIFGNTASGNQMFSNFIGTDSEAFNPAPNQLNRDHDRKCTGQPDW